MYPLIAALAATVAVLIGTVHAGQINTSAVSSAYHASFCPLLADRLRLARFDYRCEPSTGTRETISRVAANPRQLGYARLDVFAFESRRLDARHTLVVAREDDVRACVLAVTRNGQVTNWGELSAYAASLRFILPPADSGTAATFAYLQSIAPGGLAQAKTVLHAPSTEDAIRQALSADDTVSFVVLFPDPENRLLDLVHANKGHVVPVIDRAILRQQIGGKKIYYAHEIEIESPSWTKPARKAATACTPLIVFTGAPTLLAAEQARKDHEDLIRTVASFKPAELLPETSSFQRALERTRELSAAAAQRTLDLTEEARAKAKPLADKAVEKAREAGDQVRQSAERASEAAKPYVGKAKDAAQKAYEEAVRIGKELLDKAEPGPEQKKE